MPLDETITRPLIEKIIRLMDTKCVRFNRTAPHWRALFSEQLDDITSSKSSADFEIRVNSVLSRGGLSHVAFFHESAQRAPARYAINASFCSADTLDGRRWMFQDVHEGGPAHVAGARPGDILLDVDAMPVRPPALPTFALPATTLDMLKMERQVGYVVFFRRSGS
jgi:carboxyl-terminal processing protease